MDAVSDRQQAVLTMYQTPRMMVPVRTWQHRQQPVEYRRSHGEIIIFPALSQPRQHLETVSALVKNESPLSRVASAERRSSPRNDEQNPTASDLSATYHREQLNAMGRPASSQRPVKQFCFQLSK